MRASITHFTRFLTLYTLFTLSIARALGGKPQQWIQPYKRQPLQNIVTWDQHSLFVHGQRIMFYSGEFHPFRLPVPDLWLDVFQKIRSMGYTGVSFYVDWALLEGKQGHFSAQGVFALEPFFSAASKAGIYLLARPGPYINAEVSGGGFPGWLQRVKGRLRTADEDYLNATKIYVQAIGSIIAKAQITNGGPVILFQPENEYTGAVPGVKFPDPTYFQFVQDQYRAAGIVVPFLSNDASASGHNAPGQAAAVDIYGHDGYPLGFDCANPNVWPPNKLPTNWWSTHMEQSPSTPYSIPEFQGGAFDPWGGLGFEKCATLVNHEFQRVFYKNDFSFGVTIFNIYMTYGGTNWGNLGHPGGYTSYDYGAVITEDRLVSREKYSEAKLEANFLVASPSYLSAVHESVRKGSFVNTPDLTVTHLQSNSTHYLVVRHSDYSSTNSTTYKLSVTGTSAGDITIPQAGGDLTLNGRDSKIHVFDYNMEGINLLYSTAEIFTWQTYEDKTVLVVYGGLGEQHEIAVSLSAAGSLPTTILGSGISAAVKNGVTILSWKTSREDRALTLGPLVIYFLDRNSAYNYWTLDLPKGSGDNTPYTNGGDSSVIIKGGYLMRTARVRGTTMALTGDLNSTTTIEIIGGAPARLSALFFNGQNVQFTTNAHGVISARLPYTEPTISVPNLSSLTWHYVDTLPEIQPSYSDASWKAADYPKTDNSLRNLTTPATLYSSDYGYHTGTLVYRGHFVAHGNESSLYLKTQGGSAFGMSAWLNDHFLGSFIGYDAADAGESTFKLPGVVGNGTYIFTVVIDNMGLNEDWTVGSDDMKNPRGILDYKLDGHSQSDISWKLTGNFGGEDFPDKIRGPLNEGGMWAERQGYHLPAPPVESWKTSKGGPMEGIPGPGIAWYVTSFDLNMPQGYDIPLSFVFTNKTTTTATPPPPNTEPEPPQPPLDPTIDPTWDSPLATQFSPPKIPRPESAASPSSSVPAYRVQLYVNGWQFGKYVSNIGPQTKFPVPEGIWNYHGKNWVAMSLWALGKEGAKVEEVKLVAGPAILTGYAPVRVVDSGRWMQRAGAY